VATDLQPAGRLNPEDIMARLNGRRIIVTGGGSGIGAATCALLAKEGAAVAVFDRAEGAAQAVAKQVGGVAQAVDVANASDVASAVAAAAREMGGVDGLVNAAGIFSAAGIRSTTAEQFAQTLAVNVTGTFLLVQAVAPLMQAGNRGTIVNIGSGVGITPTGPGSIAYVASKGGVIAMTKAMAMELAPSIRVNVVCPGSVDTPMVASFLRRPSGEVDPEIAARYALKRAATAEEIAAAILFLTSDESSFVTGVTLPVDGGRTFH
jgi:NAD(P)-dependent dehydrogenase (short-subunit alcohol dehydrogenase family)